MMTQSQLLRHFAAGVPVAYLISSLFRPPSLQVNITIVNDSFVCVYVCTQGCVSVSFVM